MKGYKVTSMDLLAAHLFGDYVFQTDEMARLKLSDPLVRARHVTRYAACFLPTTLLAPVSVRRKVAFLALLWLSHYVTDSRRWLPNEDWVPGTIINDQALHALQLAVLRRLLAPGFPTKVKAAS